MSCSNIGVDNFSTIDLVLHQLTIFHDTSVDAAGGDVVGVFGELGGIGPVGRAEHDARRGLANAEVVSRHHVALVGGLRREGLSKFQGLN